MTAAFLLGLFICSAPPNAKPLADALRDGDIQAKAQAVSGHSLARLAIESLRADDLVLDFNGSYLVPSQPGYQRLGLGIAGIGNGETSIRLAGRGRVALDVLTVCMDLGKASPAHGARFELASKLAPEPVLGVLREWRENPQTPQQTVQSAAWEGRSLLAGLPSERSALSLPNTSGQAQGQGTFLEGGERSPSRSELEHHEANGVRTPRFLPGSSSRFPGGNTAAAARSPVRSQQESPPAAGQTNSRAPLPAPSAPSRYPEAAPLRRSP